MKKENKTISETEIETELNETTAQETGQQEQSEKKDVITGVSYKDADTGTVVDTYKKKELERHECYILITKKEMTGILKKLKLILLIKNNTMPIIECVKIDVLGNTAVFTVTDIDNTISVKSFCNTKGEGSICLSFNLLNNYIANVKEGNILIKIKGEYTEIWRDTSCFKIAGQPASEFPLTDSISDSNNFFVKQNLFAEGLKKSLNFIAKDEMRPVMEGVLMEIKENLINLTATNAHVLSTFTIKQNETNFIMKEQKNIDFIVSKKCAKIISTITDGMTKINYNENNIVFVNEDITVTSRLIDGKYPNYMSVVPAVNNKFLKVKRSEIVDIVKRVSVACDKTTGAIYFLLNGKAEIKGYDTDSNIKQNEFLEKFNYKGDDLHISFNYSYLLDVLSVLESETVLFCFTEANRASLLFPVEINPNTEHLTLIMPVMIND